MTQPDSLPDFIVIGAMKAGTTSLQAWLDAHPGIGMPALKETNFFIPGKAPGRGLDWYARQFPPGDLRRGEVSPAYAKRLVFPGTAERIAAALPRARIVYMLRDPVARALSEYRHLRAEGRLGPGALSPDAFARLIDASLYRQQIEPYLALFPASRIHLLWLEDFLADREGELARLAHFLGVENAWSAPRLAHHNDGATVAGLPRWFWRMRDGALGQALRRSLPGVVKHRLRGALAASGGQGAAPPPAGLAERIAAAVVRDAEALRALGRPA